MNELLKTRNRYLYYFDHGRYIFDQEIKIVLEQFEDEDFLIDILNKENSEEKLEQIDKLLEGEKDEI